MLLYTFYISKSIWFEHLKDWLQTQLNPHFTYCLKKSMGTYLNKQVIFHSNFPKYFFIRIFIRIASDEQLRRLKGKGFEFSILARWNIKKYVKYFLYWKYWPSINKFCNMSNWKKFWFCERRTHVIQLPTRRYKHYINNIYPHEFSFQLRAMFKFKTMIAMKL